MWNRQKFPCILDLEPCSLTRWTLKVRFPFALPIVRVPLMSYGLPSTKQHSLKGSLLSLGLVWFCACQSQSAWATCGDYLSGSHRNTDAHGANPFLEHYSSIPGNRSVPADNPPSPVCSGPQCHQRDRTPAAPTREFTVRTSDAMLSPKLDLDIVEADFRLGQYTNLRAVTGPIGRLFRPPRAA